MQVVMFLFENKFWSLSGSMQSTLLRIAQLAKDIGKITCMKYICHDEYTPRQSCACIIIK